MFLGCVSIPETDWGTVVFEGGGRAYLETEIQNLESSQRSDGLLRGRAERVMWGHGEVVEEVMCGGGEDGGGGDDKDAWLMKDE